jgi:AcrR family transcriptional regulator
VPPAGERRPRRRPDPKQGYHHGNLKAALLEGAIALIATRGADGLTLREVAQRAGVSHAAPYRHFKDKTALLAAVAEEGFREMCREMAAAATVAGANPLDRFKAIGVAYVRFAVAHPSHFRIMFGPEIPDRSVFPSLATAAWAAFEMLGDAISDCQRTGAVREGDPLRVALPAWAIVHGLAALVIDGQAPAAGHDARTVESLAQEITTAIYQGLARPSGAAPRSRKGRA